jgi:aryl-alcohol dehydrogenase-like predicted oxidoreductase
VANRSGQIGRDEGAAILRRARNIGVDTLDTAIAYGESESRLGEIGTNGWRIISKLPPLPDAVNDVGEWVHSEIAGSLKRLGTGKLSAVLLHRPADMLGASGMSLYSALTEVKRKGMVEKIGISIYDPDELDTLMPRFDLDLVQAPFNVVDRRLETSGWLSRLHAAGIEVHVRSVFLQGALLLAPSRLPPALHRWQALWQHWDSWLSDNTLTALQVCLGFALSRSEIERVVVGVDSLTQFVEIVEAAGRPALPPPAELCRDDRELINPSLWAAAT